MCVLAVVNVLTPLQFSVTLCHSSVHNSLSSVHISCLHTRTHTHMHTHTHFLNTAIELGYGHVYCMKCSDFIYHAEIDRVAMEIDQQLKEGGHSRNGQSRYHIWEPSLTEMELLRDNPKRRRLESNSTTGQLFSDLYCQ